MPLDPNLRLESERLLLRPIEVAVAKSTLAGETPAGLKFAEGYPSEFSIEVLDLIAGERQNEAPGFAPWFVVLKSENVVIGDIGSSGSTGTQTTVGYNIVPPRQ